MRILVLLILFISLSGCLPLRHVKLTESNAGAIHSVYIDPAINKVNLIDIAASANNYHAYPNNLGAAIASQILDYSMQTPYRLPSATSIENSNKDVRVIILEELSKQIPTKTSYTLNNHPGNAVLKIQILHYMTGPIKHNSDKYIVFLALRGQLFYKDKIIWDDSEHVNANTPFMLEYTSEQISKNPSLFTKMITDSTRKTINKLLDDLKRRR